MPSVVFAFGDSSKEVDLKDINSVEDVASNMKEVINQTLPVYWASYLVNGDGSGLEDGEEETIATTLEKLELTNCTCVDVKEDSHFHTPEPYMNWLDAGDYATYVFHKFNN